MSVGGCECTQTGSKLESASGDKYNKCEYNSPNKNKEGKRTSIANSLKIKRIRIQNSQAMLNMEDCSKKNNAETRESGE